MRHRLRTVQTSLVLVLVTGLSTPTIPPVAAGTPLGVRHLTQAPAPPPGRPITIRGTVVALEGARLRVATASGDHVITLVEPLTVVAARSADLGDITPGTFLGTAARTEADGTLRALEVHIFPESMRGAGEGHRPWERSGTTMTNANVEAVVQETAGSLLTLKYRGGEVQVVVPRTAPIVRFEPGERGLIVPGASIVLFRTSRADDGTISASRVTVGVGGTQLPM